MAVLNNLIYCMQAQNAGVLSAINIVGSLTPEYIPGLYSFSIVALVYDLNSDPKHSIKIEIKDPDGSSIAIASGDVNSQKIDTNLSKEHYGLNIALNLNNVEFKKEGLYNTEVFFDGSLIGNKEVYVKGKNQI